jgi:hypothetical protein
VKHLFYYSLSVIALEMFGCVARIRAETIPRYQLYWTQRIDVGTPGPRYGHALAYDSDRGITVFFGGEYSEIGGDPEYFNDTWEYDGASWKKITVDGPVPDARSRHAMCYDNRLHQVILFGGFGNGNFLNDVWDYESTGLQRGRWIPRPEATGPSPRYAHTMVFDRFQGLAIVAGGTPDSQYSQTSEVWKFNNSTGQWFLQPIGIGFYAGQNLGAGITDHMMLYDYSRHEAVLVGGVGPYGTKFLANSKIWFPGSDKATTGCGRPVTQGAIVYDGLHDVYFQFGGNDYGYLDFNPDTAVPSYETYWWPSLDVEDPCSYNPDAPTVWFKWFESPMVRPGARAQCAMVYDEKRGVTLLFGGVGGTRYSDTWELFTFDRQETWVDFNYLGREIGTFELPFKTLAGSVKEVGAVDEVLAGGTLKIKAGSTSETLRITNSMTIQAIGGPVTIGRQ